MSITFFLADFLRFKINVSYESFLLAFGIIFSDHKHWSRYLTLPVLLFTNLQNGIIWGLIFLIKQKKYRYFYISLASFVLLILFYQFVSSENITQLFSIIINQFYKPMQLIFLMGVLCTYMKNDKRSEIGGYCLISLGVPFLSLILNPHHLSVIYISCITLAFAKFCGRLKIHFHKQFYFVCGSFLEGFINPAFVAK